MYDFSKLRGRMAEQGETPASISRKIGISENAIYLKMNGKNEFKPSEIEEIAKILNIPAREFKAYFFDTYAELMDTKLFRINSRQC